MMIDAAFREMALKGARAEFSKNPALAAEFGSADEYAAFYAAILDGNMALATKGWAKQWRASASLQAEFKTEEGFVAFKRAEAAGRVHILPPSKGVYTVKKDQQK